VIDKHGNPYSGAQVQINNENQTRLLTRNTASAGTVYIYADIDNLPTQFNVTVNGTLGSTVSGSFSLSETLDAGQVNVTLPESHHQDLLTKDTWTLNKPIDLAFVIDTTGSMGDELAYIQSELSAILGSVDIDSAEDWINVGLVFYRDEGDEYVVHTHDFTSDLHQAQRDLGSETHNGGGDYPEAIMGLDWQLDSHKVLFLIADAPPHRHKMRATWTAARQARASNIHIVPVAASGVAADAEYLMRSMAALTDSRYAFLTDDSGIGNPHAEPDVDCYVVTQLDHLMGRIMYELITGFRTEPHENDIIRQVGDYDKGVCGPIYQQ